MEKMFKRLLSFAVALFLVLGMVPASVFAAETNAAQIGETGYATLAEALDAAKTMTGDVTVDIYDKVTLAESLSGSYDSIKFVGKDTDAEIYLDVQGYITATGKKVTFEDLTLSKAEGGYITNAGFMNVAFGVYDVAEVTYTNCTFANGAYASSGAVTFTGCTFYRSYDKYGLWAYGDVDVVVDGCTFADYRGIKMYAEGAAKTVNLTVKNTDFSALTGKPAIVLTYGESVTLENNTYSDTGVFELDLDGAPDGTPVTTDDVANLACTNDSGDCGVLVDGRIYTTAAQAAEVAVAGSTVVLLHDSAETVEFAEGVILDKNGYTAANVTVEESAAPAPSGSINGGLVNLQDENRTFLTIESYITYANESIVVKVFDANDTLLVTSSLVDTDRVILGKENWGGLSTFVGINCTDSWWNTTWEEGKLSADFVPAKATLYIDGVEMNTAVVQMRAAGTELAVNWADVPGVPAAAAPALPTATVTMLDAESLGLTFAMNFLADEATEEQLEYYGAWPADYVLSTNKDIVFNANGTADGWLSGQYDAFGADWVNVPDGDVTLKAGEPIRVMEYAMELMGYETALTYNDIYSLVKDFNCGVFLDEEFLAANPDLEVTLELWMYNPEDASESYAIGETYTFTAPAPKLPTATVTEIENDDLTFALNFKADDATQAQIDYYGDWYADYVLTVNKKVTFNADGTADGWLSGQYDDYSENWVNVPFEDVTLEAGESIKIMEYASIALNQPGLKLTYNDVLSFVKDFDCGVFFDEEFLANNPDLVVTLELRTYNNEDETESYVIGETYTFTAPAPELPTATTTEIENDDLTFAMNFKADEATYAQLYHYGSWYADFVLTVNKDVTFNADGGADGYLSGQYDSWSENWVDVPYGKGNVTLNAGESLKIMEFASKLMGKPGLKYTYREVYERVKDFDCGVFFTEEFLAANPDLEVTLELRIYNPADETENYLIGETYVFTLSDNVAENMNTGKQYPTVEAALAESQEGETVRLLKSVEGEKAENIILILNDRTLDLNGFTLEATNVVAVTGGAKITDSTNGKGLLKVAKANLTLPSNDQLPIWSAEDVGYRFVTVETKHWEVAKTAEYLTMMFWFTGALDGDMKHHLAKVEENELKVVLRVEYARPDGSSAILDIVVPQDKVLAYANTEVEPYFLITIRGLNSLGDATITTYAISGDVEVSDSSYDYTAITE